MYKLLGNRLLISEVAFENKTSGGLYVPEQMAKSVVDIIKGKVITIGTDVQEDFKVDDIITYPKHCYGIRVKINNNIYIVIDVKDIISIERN